LENRHFCLADFRMHVCFIAQFNSLELALHLTLNKFYTKNQSNFMQAVTKSRLGGSPLLTQDANQKEP
jgi:hypothetical protein